MGDRGTNYTTEDLRRAFLAAYNEAYTQGANKRCYREQEAWDDYAKTLRAEESDDLLKHPGAVKMQEIYMQAQQHPAQLPDALEEHIAKNYNHFQPEDSDQQRQLVRLLLEEVDKRLDDCQKNWKAATEASIESAVNRIAGAFLEVSEVDYGIGVKTMFRKMAEILEGKA